MLDGVLVSQEYMKDLNRKLNLSQFLGMEYIVVPAELNQKYTTHVIIDH